MNKNNKIFLGLIVCSALLCGLIFLENIISSLPKKELVQMAQEIPIKTIMPKVDTTAIIQKIQDAGIKPHEALYWREIK